MKNIWIIILFFIFLRCQAFNTILGQNKEDRLLDFLILYWLANQEAVCDSSIQDSEFRYQWHLQNNGQNGGMYGEDVNVIPVWNQSNWGQNVLIAVVDDGIDIEHEDLRENMLNQYNYDYQDGDTDLTNYFLYAKHGTAVAGVIGSRCNQIGVRGVAPLVNLTGYNLLLNLTTSNSADAMTRHSDVVSISNNSWGTLDGTGELDDSLASTLWKNAILDGIQNGRNGKGIIYLWAAGNGSSFIGGGGSFTSGTLFQDSADNSNYDGQANFRGVMAICAVTNQGKHAYYSELGANLWVCGQSNYYYDEGTLAITTTDIRGYYGYSTGDYNSNFGGTSSATPLVSGVVALMLKENPDLTWRDVRYILAKTARQIDPTDSDWATNGAGFLYNHKYGFGVVDAKSAVNEARTFTSLGGSSSLKNYTSSIDSPNIAIPDNNTTGISRIISISNSGIKNIEWVDVEIEFSHTHFGDLQITIQSPSGTTAMLSPAHACPEDTNSDGYPDANNCTNYTNKIWRFGVAIFLDENADGNWTLSIKDLSVNDTGTLHNWKLIIYGR